MKKRELQEQNEALLALLEEVRDQIDAQLGEPDDEDEDEEDGDEDQEEDEDDEDE